MTELCVHFGTCGGCLYQDEDPAAYRARKTDAITAALARNGIEADLAPMIVVPPHSRRRATFKVAKRKGEALIGFHARQAHDIVDMRECRLLTPALFAAVADMRAMMSALLNDGEDAELHVTDTDTGLDIAIKWQRKLTPALVQVFAKWAPKLKAARIMAGFDTAIELAQPAVILGKARTPLPPRAFLQPTREGEAVLQGLVKDALPKTKKLVDLFSGCGTFALSLAETMRVHAVERETPLLKAIEGAMRHTQGLKPVTTETRDLFKLPLTPPELKQFDAALLDPPRAGAHAQARELAASTINRVVYVSCNPESFARDAKVLIDAGFKIGPVTPVDQFLWSDHVEMMAAFTRK
jgi:23S rRNA (uracil1939-C5)-methyltransferase